MKRIICPASLFILLLLTSVLSSNLGAQESPDPLRAAMAARIDDGKVGTGVVVGLLTLKVDRLRHTDAPVLKERT